MIKIVNKLIKSFSKNKENTNEKEFFNYIVYTTMDYYDSIIGTTSSFVSVKDISIDSNNNFVEIYLIVHKDFAERFLSTIKNYDNYATVLRMDSEFKLPEFIDVK